MTESKAYSPRLPQGASKRNIFFTSIFLQGADNLAVLDRLFTEIITFHALLTLDASHDVAYLKGK
jgi:hypothetical protein